MAGGLLQPEDVGPSDRARILEFVNGATDASVLADAIGFSEGPSIGRQIAEAILARRSADGPFLTLAELLAVTGINLARFTEIAVALSGARPPAAGWTMRLTPASTRLWLGQSVQIVGQLLDAQGIGVPGAEVSCMTSSGILSAPNSRGEIQRGAAVRLTTEPAGIVRLELQPRLAPPLGLDARSALESELARIGAETDSPASVAPALAAFAGRYRAEASSALRDAVDRLFEAYPVDAAGVGSTWPVETVTIIAISEDESEQPALAGTATVSVRNWLGAWLSALGGAIRSDRRLDEALAQIDTIDADAAYSLIAATQAFAGLEYGVLGGRERDKLSGQYASRFLDRLGDNMDPVTIENVVLAAGATNAGVLDGRLFQLEATAVDKTALDTLRADILTRTDAKVADFGGRVAALETDGVTKAQLAALDTGLATAVRDLRAGIDTAVGRARTELVGQINAKADLAAVTGLNQSFRTLVDGRLAQLEAKAVDRAALDGLRNDLLSLTDGKVAAVSGKVAALESDQVTRAQLSRLETRLTQINTAVGSTRAELLVQINAKADQAALAGLNQSVTKLQTDNQRIATQVQGIDFDVLRAPRPRPPGR